MTDALKTPDPYVDLTTLDSITKRTQLEIQLDALLSENVDLRQRLYILDRRINAIRKALNEG